LLIDAFAFLLFILHVDKMRPVFEIERYALEIQTLDHSILMQKKSYPGMKRMGRRRMANKNIFKSLLLMF